VSRWPGPDPALRFARRPAATWDTRGVNVGQRTHAISGWVAPTAEQLANARRNTDAWNRGDFETWIDAFAAECDWYPTTVGAVEGRSTAIHGHEGLRAYTQQAEEVWERFQVEIADLLRRGSLSLLLGRVRTRGRVSQVETETPMFWLFDSDEHDKFVWGKSFLDPDEALSAAAEREAANGSR
jgi:ketosteroid isomerase-like protein